MQYPATSESALASHDKTALSPEILEATRFVGGFITLGLDDDPQPIVKAIKTIPNKNTINTFIRHLQLKYVLFNPEFPSPTPSLQLQSRLIICSIGNHYSFPFHCSRYAPHVTLPFRLAILLPSTPILFFPVLIIYFIFVPKLTVEFSTPSVLFFDTHSTSRATWPISPKSISPENKRARPDPNERIGTGPVNAYCLTDLS